MVASRIGDNRAAQRVEDEIFKQGTDLRGTGFRLLLLSALAISVAFLVVLLFDVLFDGLPFLGDRGLDFVQGRLASVSRDEALGIGQGLIGSFWIAIFVAGLAFPIGISAAIYLEEYAPRNFLTNAIDVTIRNLAGVPSVVYGLLGLFLFVSLIGGGASTLWAGGVTLAILVLPIVVITSAEAIRAVPSSLRQGAYGVGATKWDVIRTQILPYAAPGILTGTLLSLARAVGEAAPLILVGAVTGFLPGRSLFDVGELNEAFTALPIVILDWVQETGRDQGFGSAAAAGIIVLLVFVISMNSVAVALRYRFEKKRG